VPRRKTSDILNPFYFEIAAARGGGWRVTSPGAPLLINLFSFLIALGCQQLLRRAPIATLRSLNAVGFAQRRAYLTTQHQAAPLAVGTARPPVVSPSYSPKLPK
jgi:hypothetical protein